MSEEVIILMVIVLIASLLQTCTGYGFSIIGTPFLLFLYPPQTAIQLNIILSICLSAFMIRTIRKEVDRTMLHRLVKGSIPGLLGGIVIYLFLDIQLLKMAVGVLVLLLTVLLMMKISVARSRNRDFLAGGISGVLTTSIGVPGPPLLLYFSGAHIDQTTLRSTTLAYYLFVYSASLVMQISLGGTSKETWILSLSAIPALFIGIVLGRLSSKWMSQKSFRRITYGILLCTGIYLLFTGLDARS